jgi:hypothetical protein
VPRVFGDVEIRLVERQPFDERRHAAKDAEHLLRDRLVLLKVGPEDHEVRAQPHRARHRDGRSHTELARFVAGRRHDTAAFRPSANDDGLAF